ncbi:MAG: PqqD family peptide modification chaperone [Clostridiales bacterium]|jgi:hypothetical protein|nr:PqqD family peptide modification chaperone [Clostridiales bacterium]
MRLAVEMAIMDMDGEISAVAVGEDNSKFHGMLRLNDEAADIITILNMCRDDGISFNCLVKSLQTKYTDSTLEELAEFTKEFLKQLWQEGLLIE